LVAKDRHPKHPFDLFLLREIIFFTLDELGFSNCKVDLRPLTFGDPDCVLAFVVFSWQQVLLAFFRPGHHGQAPAWQAPASS
jgi:hypothetical protein